MKKRNPLAVLFLPFITLGIYSWYWAVKTKGEMNKMGEKIPTAWIWLIPFVGTLWWYWKYSEGVEHVTKDEVNAILAFLLLFFTGCIGQAILQSYYNKLEAAPAAPVAPQPGAPATTQEPAQSTPIDNQTTTNGTQAPEQTDTQTETPTTPTETPPTPPTNLVQ